MKSPVHPPANVRFIIAALLITEICSSLEVTMIYTALPTLNREFASPAGVGWVITACLIVSAAIAALCGRLGDLYGRQRVLLAVTAFSACGSLISALSFGLPGVTIGAALQGMSGAILPLCLALIREHLPAHRIAPTIGIVLAAATGSAAIGLAAGGFLVEHFGWRSIFWASGSWALLSVFAIWRWIPNTGGVAVSRERVSLVKGVLFAPAIAALLLALTLAKDHAISDPRVYGTVIVALLVLAYWVRHQLGEKNPLINLRMLADRRIATAYFCIAMVGMGMMQHTLIMSMMLQQPVATAIGFGLAASVAGALLMPVRLVGVVASPLSGRIAARYGPRSALLAGCGLAIVGWTLILLFHGDVRVVLFGMVLEGAGFAVCYVAVPAILLQVAPAERAGEVTGLSSVFRALFTAVGAQIVMLILDASTMTFDGDTVRYPTEDAYELGVAFILLVCVICAAAAWSLNDDRPKRQTDLLPEPDHLSQALQAKIVSGR